MPKVAAVIPAGGVGARFGARTPKQFLRLGRLSILAATVRHFARHPAVRAVVVAAPESWVARARRILGRVAQDASLTVVAGGRTRQDSVRSEEHTSELQSRENLVCRLLLEKKKKD